MIICHEYGQSRATRRTYPNAVAAELAAQTILTLVIALPLALRYGPATAFQLLATILTAVMLCIYIVISPAGRLYRAPIQGADRR